MSLAATVRCFCCAYLFTQVVTTTHAQELRFQSSAKQTALIELYTSEGCSSCLPAEAWLSQLKADPGLWTSFVPVAFHVDYWDNLSWRDRFAAAKFTARQCAYAVEWAGGSLYTPAFAVNGREWRGWSGGRKFSTANKENIGVLTAETRDAHRFTITFEPQQESDAQWQAHLALLGCEISSRISAGENGGRNLRHDFVVLDERSAPMKSKEKEKVATAEIVLDSASPADVPPKAIAVWVARPNQPIPVQATGGWLFKK
jgi:hypothetical protein